MLSVKEANNVKNNNNTNKPASNVLIIDEETRKRFQEKRKARQDEIKTKIESQRKKNVADTSKGAIPKKPEIKKHEDNKEKLAPKNFQNRKPNVQKLPIKQTIASQLRLQKNNPFHGLNLDEIKKMVETEQSRNTSFQTVKNNGQLDTQKTLSERKSSKSATNTQPIKRFSRLELLSKPKVLNAKSQQEKEENKPSKLITKKSTAPMRRSISSVHLRKLSSVEANRCIHNTGMLKARSEENVSFGRHLNIPSPISEESESNLSRISCTGRKAVMFTTPSKRNSRSFSSSTSQTPLPSELREQLIKWLKKRGKSLNSYSHLRCFGIHQSTPYRPARGTMLRNGYDDDDEDKENNVEYAMNIPKDDGLPKVIDYTNFKTNEDIFETPTKDLNKNKLAQNALCDLHALILEKYPQEQCTAWLAALKRKYPNLQDQPQYWECRAALGEINGEFNEAVECYQEAIIKGAEVSKIDHSIEQLLEKFSILDLDSSTKKQDTTAKKHRSKVILDARNIFRSSVIKFAVSQRERRSRLKDQTEVLTPLVAKPVRRSTRKSISCYTTPKESLYNSLREIETSLRESVCFEKNQALIDNS